MKVTKIDAAKRQVLQAIELWFDNGDPVSIHTLLFAAVEIIHNLYRRRTGRRLFFQNEAMQKAHPAVCKAVRDWPNFFKHGRDYELDKVLDFNPNANLVLFSACVAGLAGLGQSDDDLIEAFSLYCLIHHPEFFNEATRAGGPKGEMLASARRLSKKSFLKSFLKGARRRRKAAMAAKNAEATTG